MGLPGPLLLRGSGASLLILRPSEEGREEGRRREMVEAKEGGGECE